MLTLKENMRPQYGVFSSALGGETSDTVTTAAFVSLKNYNKAGAYGIASGVASGSIITLTLMEGKSTAGSASQTTTFTDTFTATATNHLGILQAEMFGTQLSSGFTHVGFKLVTDNASGTEKVAGVLWQALPDYPQATLPA
jgi:hypothetical protein